MKKQSIRVFELRKSVHYWWSYILFSPECKELTSMLDPLLYRWGVPPVVIRCVHWTMQSGVLQTCIKALGLANVMNVWIQIKISLKFVPKGPINNIPSLVQIMVWRRPGDKPLSEPMMVNLLTYICVTRPQWLNYITNLNVLIVCPLCTDFTALMCFNWMAKILG